MTGSSRVPQVTLGEVAHSRAGDKGDSSILLLVPYRHEDFDRILAELTPAVVAAHFGIGDPVDVSVVPAPGLGAFSIVVRHRLSGGVTRSPSIDPHGKTLSGHLLDLAINWPGVESPAKERDLQTAEE